ncbi:hypothetical protein ACFX14_002549 [Malus domestica]
MTWQDQSRLGPPSTRPIVHTVRIYLRLKCGRGTQRARERSETKPGRVPVKKPDLLIGDRTLFPVVTESDSTAGTELSRTVRSNRIDKYVLLLSYISDHSESHFKKI